MKRVLASVSLLLLLLQGCSCFYKDITEAGVSQALAIARKSMVEDLNYDLFFAIPDSKQEKVAGDVNITFIYRPKSDIPLVLDFKEGTVNTVRVNDGEADYEFENEHIIIPASALKSGLNSVIVNFISSDRSLNRRDEFMYTLLVPDRARTLFPCMDQPDLKARYHLTLSVPKSWSAVSNSPIVSVSHRENRQLIQFERSEPLSTYLFSFVVGKFDSVEKSCNGRTIHLYHRESDPIKVAQCDEILSEVFESMAWLEEYTGIEYPFAKYDFIILPGFQYSGMEHTGATLYNDGKMFLDVNAGINERMFRYNLIAHETAHMWFGDYVTMKWFNDVWTKEVFANYFAAKMMEEKFPDVDNSVNFINYQRSAFAEDRTSGASPIKQPLDNLSNAGLIYSNIIYNKAPIVMNMLADKCGEDAFRQGIRDYLDKFAYSNATWEELIDILDGYCADDLKEWSHKWVFTSGIPIIESDGEMPDFDTLYYGYYVMDSTLSKRCLDEEIYHSTQSRKGYILINVNENVLNGRLNSATYLDLLFDYLAWEQDPISFSHAASYLGRTYFLYFYGEREYRDWDAKLWQLLETAKDIQSRRSVFNLICSYCDSPGTTQRLYDIFCHPELFKSINLSENDLTSLAFELSVRKQSEVEKILSVQRARISNPDRLARFDFILRAVDSDTVGRDAFFNALLQQENREIEPWASTALALLNHPLYGSHSVKYIKPGLDLMEEVQRTGDIFFPKNWASALLSSHKTQEAKDIVNQWLEESSCSVMLKNKVRLVKVD